MVVVAVNDVLDRKKHNKYNIPTVDNGKSLVILFSDVSGIFVFVFVSSNVTLKQEFSRRKWLGTR